MDNNLHIHSDQNKGGGASEKEQGHKEGLNKARKDSVYGGKKNISDAAEAIKQISAMKSPWGALSLLKEIDMLKDMPFFAAIGAGLLKDISDFVGIGSLPGIGTVVTLCVSIFIGMMMLLAGGGGGKKRKTANTMVKRLLTLGGGTLVEFLPGIDFLPVETITGIVLYVMFLMERKSAKD